MKESSWRDCLDSNSSIKITPDKGKAKSLIETAEGRIEFSKAEVNSSTCNYIFENYYSSILELVHALTLFDGFKINNHICLGYYLKDILNREDLFRIFDDCRYKRNSLVYYGKRMDLETCRESIEKALKLIKELRNIIKEKIR
jgi:uncharacterized protein (UPF0332 family)